MAVDVEGYGTTELTLEEQRVLGRFREFRRTRSAELRDQLVLEHTNLVEKLARQFSVSGEPVEDLVQEGYIGLIKAVDRFEPDKEVKFVTYATHVISGEIRHYLRDLGKLIHEPGWHQQLRFQITRAGDALQQKLGRQATPEEIGQALGIEAEKVKRVLVNSQVFQVESLDATMEEDDDGNTGATRLDQALEDESHSPNRLEDSIVLRQAMAKLGKLQRTVVFHFFFQELSKTEIARKLGISVNYTCYLLKRALKNLRQTLEDSAAPQQSAEVEQRLAEIEHRVQAEMVDVETRLPTATSFHKQLRQEVVRARRYPQEFAVVLFDVTGLKSITPPLSQREMENVSRQFVNLLRHNSRDVDKFYRYDDRRFVALLPHTGEGGKNMAERVQQAIQQEPLTRSTGQPLAGLRVIYRLALFPADGNTPEELWEVLLKEEKSVECVSRPNGETPGRKKTSRSTNGNGAKGSQ